MTKRLAKNSLKCLCLSFLFWFQGYAQDQCSEQCQTLPAYNSCDSCEPGNRFCVDAEYLYWKIKNSPNPVPLLVTVPFAHNRAPLIGQPGTRVVLGGKSSRNNWRSGGRFNLSYWFDAECRFGAEVNYFFLPNRTRKETASSSGLSGSKFLSVPFFDTAAGSESSSPVAVPGSFAGLATLKIHNKMQGAEINGIAMLYSDCTFQAKALAGFRYWNFNERLNMFVDSPAINIPGEIYIVKDRFHTENNFYGGQIGIDTDCSYQRFFFNAKGKIALGVMREQVNIDGEFITNDFNGIGAPQNFPGGYFALPSNLGHHKHNCFAIIPEVNINIGYQVLDCLRIQVGYTFLYVNKMLWAGKQINRNINPTQSALYEFTATPTLVGQAKPKPSIKNDSLWAQGLNVGFDFQF